MTQQEILKMNHERLIAFYEEQMRNRHIALEEFRDAFYPYLLEPAATFYETLKQRHAESSSRLDALRHYYAGVPVRDRYNTEEAKAKLKAEQLIPAWEAYLAYLAAMPQL